MGSDCLPAGFGSARTRFRQPEDSSRSPVVFLVRNPLEQKQGMFCYAGVHQMKNEIVMPGFPHQLVAYTIYTGPSDSHALLHTDPRTVNPYLHFHHVLQDFLRFASSCKNCVAECILHFNRPQAIIIRPPPTCPLGAPDRYEKSLV